MNIFEIFNTQADGIKWSSIGHIHNGKYKLEEDLVEIILEEFDTKFRKSLVEFGFSVNGSIQAKNDPTIKARLIGSVINGATPQLEKLNPDVILICVNKKSGLIESRKSIYSTIIKRIMKRSAYTYHHEWIENSVGFYALIAKQQISEDEEASFISLVKQK